MRRLTLWLGILVTMLVLAIAALWWVLRPPHPLTRHEAGAELADVTVVNPGAGRTAHRTVRIEAGRIAAVDPAGPEAAGRYRGSYVLPGLIDMHVHFPPPSGLGQTELFAFLFLYHGVTTVRDAGDVDGTTSDPARQGVRSGRFAGPRIFSCGPFVDGPNTLWGNSLVVEDPADAEAAVARVADAGYECVKVYDDLSPAALAAVVAAARARDLPVIGHVPRRVRYGEGGLDDVQHLTGVATELGDLRRFPKNMGPWLELDDTEIESVVAAAVEGGFANTPTLVTRERLTHLEDYETLRQAPDAALLPRFYRDAIWNPAHGAPFLRTLEPRDFAVLRGSLERARRLVRRLHESGAQLHVGTDTLTPFVVPGAALHRELANFVDAGLSAEEAWMHATRSPGEFLRVPGLGTVSPGAPADLLIFAEDPTRDLAALASLRAVVADGRLYPREALDAQLARYRDYAAGGIFDTVSVTLTKRMLARIFAEP